MLNANLVRQITAMERKLERLHSLEFPHQGLVVQDEGVTIGANPFEEINFVGSSVEALVDGLNPKKADINFSDGAGSSITGCYVYGYAPIGTASSYIWGFSNERWDPDGMFDAGVDDEKVYFPEEGYWLLAANMYGTVVSGTLIDDINKMAQYRNYIWVQDDIGYSDLSLYTYQYAYALSATGYKNIFRGFATHVLRYDGHVNPYATVHFNVQYVPGIGSWNSAPSVTAYINLIAMKLGDL